MSPRFLALATALVALVPSVANADIVNLTMTPQVNVPAALAPAAITCNLRSSTYTSKNTAPVTITTSNNNTLITIPIDTGTIPAKGMAYSCIYVSMNSAYSNLPLTGTLPSGYTITAGKPAFTGNVP